MKLVARVQLNPNSLFKNLCFKSKNLYNRANYVIRQEFITKGKWLRYNALQNLLKTEQCYLEFKELAGSHPPQQTLRILDKNWKSFFAAIKDWRKPPEKYRGIPHPPKYLKKDGKFVVVWTKLQTRVIDNFFLLTNKLLKLGFPKFPIDKLKVNKVNYRGARLVPLHDRFMFEIIYTKEPKEPITMGKNTNAIGSDIGLNNLIASSDGLLIKGGAVKSINQYINKYLAKYKSLAKKCNDSDYTNRIARLYRIRYNKLHDFFHKVSRKLINHCVFNNISTVIIGYNELWKQNVNLGKKNNQNFVNVPFAKLISMIEYKAILEGIEVRRTIEEYTSQTCSSCGIVLKSNRVSRGLYICKKCGAVMNANRNAAINIVKKEFPKSLVIGNRGFMNHPTGLIT